MNLTPYAPLAQSAIDEALAQYNRDHAIEIADAKYHQAMQEVRQDLTDARAKFLADMDEAIRVFRASY